MNAKCTAMNCYEAWISALIIAKCGAFCYVVSVSRNAWTTQRVVLCSHAQYTYDLVKPTNIFTVMYIFQNTSRINEYI